MSKKVTIEGLNALSTKVTKDSLTVRERIRKGTISEAEAVTRAECAQEECVRMAVDITHYINDELVNRICASSLTVPFIAAALTTMGEIVIGLLADENGTMPEYIKGLYDSTCSLLKDRLEVTNVSVKMEEGHRGS